LLNRTGIFFTINIRPDNQISRSDIDVNVLIGSGNTKKVKEE